MGKPLQYLLVKECEFFVVSNLNPLFGVLASATKILWINHVDQREGGGKKPMLGSRSTVNSWNLHVVN